MSSTPPIDSPADEIRDAGSIARRALALFGVVGLALGAPPDDVRGWLKEESLWDDLTPEELAYVSAEDPPERQRINASWRSEALTVLLWALGKVDTLPSPHEQCDTAVFQKVLPPYVEITVQDFMASATRRSDAELLDMAEALLQQHWEARDAKSHSRPTSTPIDIEVVQERHHAINWVIGYEGLSWDEITTDT
jgi:hypothetical protein